MDSPTPQLQLAQSPLEIERFWIENIRFFSGNVPEVLKGGRVFNFKMSIHSEYVDIGEKDKFCSRLHILLQPVVGEGEEGPKDVLECMIVGVFRLTAKVSEAVEEQLKHYSPAAMLYSAARGMLAQITAISGWGAYSLPAIIMPQATATVKIVESDGKPKQVEKRVKKAQKRTGRKAAKKTAKRTAKKVVTKKSPMKKTTLKKAKPKRAR